MESKTGNPAWVKISETLLRAVRRNPGPEIELPPRDTDRNDEVLARVRDEDPLLAVMLSYSQTHIEINLRQAFNPALTAEQQNDFKNRAAGVAALVDDLSNNRARLRQELLEQQRREAARTPKKQ